jgi:hypothetical protein
MHKKQIQQRFREKAKAARSARAIPPEQDWSGIDAVIDTLKRTLTGDGPP